MLPDLSSWSSRSGNMLPDPLRARKRELHTNKAKLFWVWGGGALTETCLTFLFALSHEDNFY